MTTISAPSGASPSPAPSGGAAADSADLASFGYEQQLHRKLGSFASFAAGFSFVSILTTVFQLFAFGFAFGGPAFFWTWPLVFAGQLLVALCFAELAARYPIAGCVYQWSRRLSTGVTGWFAGWLMLLGQIVSVAAAAIALQVALPQIWSGFQLVGTDTALSSKDGATNAVLLGTALIAVTTLITAVGVKVMSLVNSVGVACELVGVALLVVLLFAHSERGPSVVTETGGVQGGGSYVGAFLVSALMAAYVMYGFDSAGELAEETRDPRRTAPRAIVRALVASGVAGLLLLLAALMAAPSVTDGELAHGGLPYVLTSQLGTGLGKALLVDVAVAMFVCTLAIQTAATRLVFSMSRDGVLPGSARLAKVSPRTGTPVLPALVVGVLAAALLLVNVGRAELFTALTSVAIVLVYLAYLLVTVPLLVARLRGRLPAGDGFSLGRFGPAVNAAAVVYGVLMAVNIGWPRAEVYDPEGGHWYLEWFAALFLAGVLAVGAAAYGLLRRERGRATSAPVPHAGSAPVAAEATP
ncbi:amino acid permease [Yinghuangia seranimata]|uniref:amino acid permease n=1 Tax=Yinghuangia seranimata TaxID=408067 RepID=UPI00248B77EB|nr:amino acid permease [Yinghuangia seranimata]MDI2132882.1 amino acid permease [Yinghuangia seranimata]